MEIASNSKPIKWFSNKRLRLSLPRIRLSKSKSSNSLSPPSTTVVNHTSSGKEEEFQQVFRRFDSDGDGKISAEELSAYFASIGDYSIMTEEAQRVIKDFDDNGDNLLEFKDFVKLMEQNEDDDDLRRAFEMYEVDKGSGCITPVGLQRMLNRLGDAKSYEECVAMIRVFDLDGNGVLDFHEFQQMMRS